MAALWRRLRRRGRALSASRDTPDRLVRKPLNPTEEVCDPKSNGCNGALSVDFVTRTVSLNGTPIGLTRKEYELLHILALHLGQAVTCDYLLKEIWTSSQRRNSIQYLRVLVRDIRQKIEMDPEHPQLLLTASSIGYRLQITPSLSPDGS